MDQLGAGNFHNTLTYNNSVKYYYYFEVKYPAVFMNELIQQIFLQVLP